MGPVTGRAALLSILIAVPLVAGVPCLFLNANGARWIALITTLIDFALGIYLWAAFDPSGAQWQFVENVASAAASAGRWASTASR